jgi:hypothetical protein
MPVNVKDKTRAAFSWPHNSRDNGLIHVADWENPLVLSQQPQAIYDYFGFDWLKYSEGFITEEETWIWFVSSPYFDIDMFLKESIDGEVSLSETTHSRGRDRSKKRPSYKRFLVWLSEKVPTKHYESLLDNPILKFGVQEQCDYIVNQYDKCTARKEKFSGYKLVERGYEKQDIGKVLQWLETNFERTYIDSNKYNSLDDWLDNVAHEIVDEWIDHALSIMKSEM